MFGDIITDLGGMLTGGLGIAASGNIHPGQTSMFEPVHGSAPKYAGKGVASPIASILSVSMMLEFLGESRAAKRVEDAVAGLLSSGRLPSLGTGSGVPTSKQGDLVLEQMAAPAAAGR